MASAKKTTTLLSSPSPSPSPSPSSRSSPLSVVSASAAPPPASASNMLHDWTIASADRRDDQRATKTSMTSLIRPVDPLPDTSATASTKGISLSLSLSLTVARNVLLFT
ncbi:hypothetical protein V6N13_032384 [Hibiscus sabdariffa]|uniref:Uncharacterized protein n=1 Tax=Hibiscus sabdariffa TaxID=183260 RepID=A0ABR2C195_9ROSI